MRRFTYYDLTEQVNRLNGEVNANSILALDRQIREHEEAIRKLKRTRNSLLNIHRLPPEVLGKIFVWNVTRKGDFGGLKKESHNFLHVCHYWLKVASRTPEVWSFWGNTPEDWERWHHCPRAAPLDLILGPDNNYHDYLDDALINSLQDRANRDTIRRVHLASDDATLLEEIISSLTPECKEVRSSRMEALLLRNSDSSLVDLSDFLTRRCFPRLHRLEVAHCKISSWDHLTSRTGALTSLNITNSSPTPTTSQLLSTFASNPALQEIELDCLTALEDDKDASSFHVALHHLEYLSLAGDFQPVFGLLNQLDYPTPIGGFTVTLSRCTYADISRTIGPYFRDHLQRCDSPQSGLGLTLSYQKNVALRVGNVGEEGSELVEMDNVVALELNFDRALSEDRLEAAALELVLNVPSNNIVYFRAYHDIVTTGGIYNMYTQLPNLKTLDLYGIWPPAVFLEYNPDKDWGFLPSLQHLTFQRSLVDNNYWIPFMTFLSRRVSSGKRLRMIKISSFRVPPDVERAIKETVERFETNWRR